jgi:signal transduction histidine kinase
VYDDKQSVLYQSSLTRYVEIPKGKTHHRRYTVELIVPPNRIDIGQDERDEVLFRVRVFTRQVNGKTVTMRIAKPIEELEIELVGVLKEALWGVLVGVCLIVWMSYYLAGRFLRPVVAITSLARKISDESLDQRIPLGKNNDELVALSRALNKMFDGLQYSFERQRAFLSNGSHELKSPLTRLLLAQDELLQNQDLPDELRDTLERQFTTMRQMKKLVQNLLSLSQLDHQQTLSLEVVDLSELILDVVDNYHEMFEAMELEVNLDLQNNLIVPGDRLKLRRLFVNLIDNAIQYNDPDHGVLTITGKTKDGQCIIDIDNAGEAIPAADQALVFEQFYRVEKSRSSDHGGVGLGLTMCKKIVELHGGRIQVRCGFLGGTQFRIILSSSL